MPYAHNMKSKFQTVESIHLIMIGKVCGRQQQQQQNGMKRKESIRMGFARAKALLAFWIDQI